MYKTGSCDSFGASDFGGHLIYDRCRTTSIDRTPIEPIANRANRMERGQRMDSLSFLRYIPCTCICRILIQCGRDITRYLGWIPNTTFNGVTLCTRIIFVYRMIPGSKGRYGTSFTYDKRYIYENICVLCKLELTRGSVVS